MRKALRISLLLAPAFTAAALLLCPSTAHSTDSTRLVIEIPDTTASPGETLSWLSIRLGNYFDTVAGIQIQLVVDRPDLVWFDLAGPNYDTAGSLLSGWEMVIGQDTAGDHSIYGLVALANVPFSGPVTPGISPQPGNLLVRIPFSTAPSPDPANGLTCNIGLIGNVLFSDPVGQPIGYVVVDTIPDTLYYRCTDLNGDSCLGWVQVDPELSTWDSIYVYNIYLQELDSIQVIINTGSLTLVIPDTATCDHTVDGRYSVADLTCLVNYLFKGGSCESNYCDCDGSGNTPPLPNVGDLTCFVSFLFRGGPPPGQ